MKRVGMVGFIVLGIIFLSTSAHAEIYKWVDENGKVHFSDRKIVTQAEKVNVKTGSSSSAKASQKHNTQNLDTANSNVEQRLLEKQKYVNFLKSERLEREEKRKEAQAEKEEKRKLCSAMQDKLISYSEGGYRWYDLDEKTGERIYASDEKIQSRKATLQADIKANCS